MLNEMKATFDIKEGVQQGDTILPRLFTNCLEYIFRNIDWDYKGININEETLHHLKFADIVLICLVDSSGQIRNEGKETA